MSRVTHAREPTRQRVLRVLPPSESPLIRLVRATAIALTACSIALPAAASADQSCDLKTHSVQPPTGSCVPVPDDTESVAGFRGGDHPGMSRAPQYDAPTTIEVVRPDRTIVRDDVEALPLILSGTALLLVLAGVGFTLVRTRMVPRSGRSR
jgi:hypothetical protein